MFARSFYQGYFIHPLSTLHYCNAPGLATRLTGNYRDRTCTGKCGPASLDTPYTKNWCSLSTTPVSIPLYKIFQFLLCLLIRYFFNYQNSTYHQDNSYRQTDKCILNKARNNIVDKCYCCNRNCVWKLCRNMVYMVTLCSC